MKVSIYNGAGQSDYLYGLVSGLISSPVKHIDVIDIDVSSHLFNEFEKVTFRIAYRYQKKGSSYFRKAINIIRFYLFQAKHLLFRKRGITHFQWLDRYYITDRILLPLLSRLRGHKTVLTVHNVNAGKRDNRDSLYNRLTLSIVYKLCNHLIVHTESSKKELINEFNVNPDKISVIRHGMNNKVLYRGLTKEEATRDFNIEKNQKVILFFGNIDYYKGLDILIDSINYLNNDRKKDIVLLIAGNYKSHDYYDLIRKMLNESEYKNQIIAHIKFIADEDIEKYFLASDCIILPYRDIYQSGVLFMAYNFGLPAIATRVGNFENDILDGKTGILTDSVDAVALAKSIEKYFDSDIYKNLSESRKFIRDWSSGIYSWNSIGDETYNLYKHLLNGSA